MTGLQGGAGLPSTEPMFLRRRLNHTEVRFTNHVFSSSSEILPGMATNAGNAASPIVGSNTVAQKKSCLSEKGDLSSVVVEDIPNNPTSADFSYHIIRIVGFSL